MRSYNSLTSQVKNSQLKLTNNLTLGLASVVNTGVIAPSGASDASVNYIYENFATKVYVDNAVSGGGGGNIDLSSYATKSYVDTSLNSYAKNSSLASYALTSYVDGSLNNIRSTYATKIAVDASLSSYATKSAVDASLSSYATKSAVDASLSSYATKSAVDASLSSYATKSAVDASLSTYSLTTYVDGSLNNIRSNYTTKTYVDNSLATVRTDYASYVDTQISQLIGAATPATLNTLYEIANAIGSDASFSVTVLNKIASSDSSINYIRSNYTTNTKFDASINNLQSQINSVSGSSLTQTYVDGSLNDIRTNYATKSYVDTSLNTALTSYATRTYVDTSLNAALTSYATRTYVDGSLNNYATTASLAGYISSGVSTDVSMNGNVQLGGGNRFVAVNKVPGSTYALDVSGQTLLTGNVAVYKGPSDPSYSYLDMSGVNLNIFACAEKFVSVAYTSTTPTFNCTQGTVFAITSIPAPTVFTSFTFTSVPAVLNQSVSLTVMLINSAAGAGTWFNGTSIIVNGTSRQMLEPDAVVFTVPSGNRSIVIYQFVVLWVSLASPIVLAYQSALG